MESVNWWSISWDSLPSDEVNGILLGYELVYYIVEKSGLEVGVGAEKTELELDVFTFYYKVTGLENYAAYNVSVTGFTAVGNGPAPIYLASKFL